MTLTIHPHECALLDSDGALSFSWIRYRFARVSGCIERASGWAITWDPLSAVKVSAPSSCRLHKRTPEEMDAFRESRRETFKEKAERPGWLDLEPPWDAEPTMLRVPWLKHPAWGWSADNVHHAARTKTYGFDWIKELTSMDTTQPEPRQRLLSELGLPRPILAAFAKSGSKTERDLTVWVERGCKRLPAMEGWDDGFLAFAANEVRRAVGLPIYSPAPVSEPESETVAGPRSITEFGLPKSFEAGLILAGVTTDVAAVRWIERGAPMTSWSDSIRFRTARELAAKLGVPVPESIGDSRPAMNPVTPSPQKSTQPAKQPHFLFDM